MDRLDQESNLAISAKAGQKAPYFQRSARSAQKAVRSPSQIHHRFPKHRPGRGKWIIVWIAAITLGGLKMIAAETRPTGAGDKPANDPARLLFIQHCEKCHSGPKHKG